MGESGLCRLFKPILRHAVFLHTKKKGAREKEKSPANPAVVVWGYHPEAVIPAVPGVNNQSHLNVQISKCPILL